MEAAATQCVPLPSDWPLARTLFGKISAIQTQITAPCPTACEAMKRKTKRTTGAPPASAPNAQDTAPSETI